MGSKCCCSKRDEKVRIVNTDPQDYIMDNPQSARNNDKKKMRRKKRKSKKTIKPPKNNMSNYKMVRKSHEENSEESKVKLRKSTKNISEFDFSELLDDFEDQAAEENYLKTYQNTFTNATQEKKPSSTAFLAQQLKCQKQNHRKSMHNILEATPRGSDMFSQATPKANKLRRKMTDAKYQGKVIGFNEGIQFKRDMTFRERERGTKIFHFSVV
ncbi:unnamed protein product [Moneuplotes crassus]|uniref:Uncharacterized protein n=1 Tax=Euplotes crassus TaxID=5936 RepID=A0AAD1UHG8_EUPCR|nr:unnamed protein product [Moneuplotes crassus]